MNKIISYINNIINRVTESITPTLYDVLVSELVYGHSFIIAIHTTDLQVVDLKGVISITFTPIGDVGSAIEEVYHVVTALAVGHRVTYAVDQDNLITMNVFK